MWIMDIEELTAMIPSETVRNYVMESKWTFTDREKAALLYHSDLSLKEQYTRLGNLRDTTTDEGLQRQLTEYLEREKQAIQAFKENAVKRCVYILKVQENGGFHEGEYLARGYFFDWNVAFEYGKKENVPFQIEKYLVNAVFEFDDGTCNHTSIADLHFNKNGEASFFSSREIPDDNEQTDWYECFENMFYESPNPFEIGDIVRLVGTEKYGIVEVSQKHWKENLERYKQRRKFLPDYSDVQVRVIFLTEDGTFIHSHINPVNLELHQSEQEPQDPIASARDQLLHAASLLYRKDDSSNVIGSLDDLYVYTMKYRNAKGAATLGT